MNFLQNMLELFWCAEIHETKNHRQNSETWASRCMHRPMLAQGPLSAWVLALAQIRQPQASICFVVARLPLRGSQEELAAAQSGEKPKYL